MKIRNDIWTGEAQNIVVSPELPGMGCKALSPKILFGQSPLLNHDPPGPVENENTIPGGAFECGDA
jgi:hypothetical protein